LQVNGERNPSEVYKDFRSVVLQTLGMHDQGTEGPVAPANIAPAPVVEKISESILYKAPAKGFPPVIWVIGECVVRNEINRRMHRNMRSIKQNVTCRKLPVEQKAVTLKWFGNG
jgi:hypothetical protein